MQALLDDVQRARAAHDAKDRGSLFGVPSPAATFLTQELPPANAERRADVTGCMDAVSSVVDLYAQRLGFTFSGCACARAP